MNQSQDLDREAFRRVWRRVMPEDRADCPFTLAEPAVAAVAQTDIPDERRPDTPSARPQNQGPRPNRPQNQGQQPTRPQPPAIRPPAQPPRPQRPGGGPPPRPQPPAPRPPMGNRPPVCLGEGSRDELPGLERLIRLTAEDRRIYRALARRWPQERLFGQLAEAKANQLRKLTTARFLIDGRRPTLPPASLPRVTATLSQALRERHREEQERAMDFFQAANVSRDPCLVALYRDIGQENQRFARRIRERLERR